MKVWAKEILGDLCSLITDGKHGDCRNEDSSGYYFISCKDVREGRIHYENARQIVRGDFAETHRRTDLRPGDILLTNSGTIGRLAIAPDNEKTQRTTFQKSVAILKPLPETITSQFLYYSLAADRDRLINSAGGAAQKNLLLGELRRFPIRVPPLAEQTEIASILSAYDNLIENNRRRIQLLEQAARLLYREWFVCLRFPGHEHVKIIDGVPEGWEKKALGELIEIKKGKNITKDTANEGDVPVVAGGLTPAYFHDTSNAIGPVITISASGANAGYVNIYHEDIWVSDCSYISQESTNYLYYYFLLLKSKQKEIFGLQRGAAQPHVYPKDLIGLTMIFPPNRVVRSFEETISNTFLLIKNLTKQNKLLAQARDLLHPRLMNGEIKI